MKIIESLKNFYWIKFFGMTMGIISAFIGILFLLLSLVTSCFNVEGNFIFLIVGYLFIVLGIGLAILAKDKNIFFKSKEISWGNLFYHCFLYPTVIFSFAFSIANKNPNWSGIIIFLSSIIQSSIIIIWFWRRLKKSEKRSDAELSRLDLYSTVVILLLTIVWVIYDISTVKSEFAILLGTFMAVQVLIKRKALNNEESGL